MEQDSPGRAPLRRFDAPGQAYLSGIHLAEERHALSVSNGKINVPD
jgi:hypothetical protein